jgi:uncharacterized protein YjdB
MKLGCPTAIGTARLMTYACLVTAAACGGGGGGGDITPPTPTVTQVTLSPGSATIIAGQTTSITAQPKDAAGNAVNGLVIGWSVNDPNIATVSNGTVTAVRPGQATITATAGNVSNTAAITVIPAVANVTVTSPTSTLLVGQTTTLTPALTDAGGVTITGRTITWTSSNDAIASVSSLGVVTAKALGAVTITATVEGKIGTTTIEVKSATVTSVSVTSGTVRVGATLQLQATGTLSDGSKQPLSGSAVLWTSNDESKAKVDPSTGLVTGVAVGQAIITATNPASGKAAGATVNVVASSSPIVTTLSVSPASADVRVSAQTVTVSGTASDGSGTGIKSVVVTASGHTLSTTHADPTTSCTATTVAANGAWSCALTIAPGVAAGQWPIVAVVVTDNASHVTTYGDGSRTPLFGASFTVTSEEDVVEPSGPANITVSPTNFNVGTSSQRVDVSSDYGDNLSGVVSFTYRATSPANPNTYVECAGTLISGTPTAGRWGCSVTIPQGSDPGLWAQRFTALDAAGNVSQHTIGAFLVVSRTP